MAFLLDTNVISEIQRPRSDARVIAWLAGVHQLDLHTSVLVVGEIRRGIERLRTRDPKQAERIDTWTTAFLGQFGDRVLPITNDIAQTWGRLTARRPLAGVDGLLVATAGAHGLTFVSREADRYADLGVKVMNPWK